MIFKPLKNKISLIIKTGYIFFLPYLILIYQQMIMDSTTIIKKHAQIGDHAHAK
jgi:hypothetical protein